MMMQENDAAQGYVTDSSYTDRFFRELSPAWLNYVAALRGARPCDTGRAFTYLELGCGLGTSAVVNAGAFPRGEFHACDINPAHVEAGTRSAAALGVTNIAFHESSFRDLAARDLPMFDFVVLHGVYSWIGAEARSDIRAILRDRVKPGGLVYVSYNCLPGWSVEIPLRRLLVELTATAEGTSAERAERAVQALKGFGQGTLRYVSANPEAAKAIDAYVASPGNYLAHEFLNETWEPFYSIDVGDEMESAGLHLLGSATLADNHPELLIDDRSAQALAKLPSARQRQLMFDFSVNRRFRRDVFVRGRPDLQPVEAARNLGAAVVGCLGDPARLGARARVPRGEIHFHEDFMRELRRLLARGSLSLGEIVAALGRGGRDVNEIARNLRFLVAAEALIPFARASGRGAGSGAARFAGQTVARAVAHVLDLRTGRAVPSEVAGNGVPVTPVEALAMTEIVAGARGVEALAVRLREQIGALGLPVVHEGKELPPEGVSPAHAKAIAAHAIDVLLPNMVRVGLITRG